MKLSEIKQQLSQLSELKFQLPNGTFVPSHFHVTEVGIIDKKFIDCGGAVRSEQVVNFQLWQAEDYDHRLAPKKLVDIIELSERTLGIGDHEVEVEYQGETIGKYGLEFDGAHFRLINKQTDCLAPEKCGIPAEKPRIKLSEIGALNGPGCEPGSGCC